MASRGVHVILGAEERDRLLAAPASELRARIEELGGYKEASRHADSGPYWDAIHRSLSNGTLFWDEGEYPLNRVVLGGRQLSGDAAFAVVLAEPGEVSDVSAALRSLTPERFAKRYEAIDPDDYDGEHGDEDRRLAWGKLQGIRRLFDRAAAEGAALLFTAERGEAEEDDGGEEE
jgi:hypothetical protein